MISGISEREVGRKQCLGRRTGFPAETGMSFHCNKARGRLAKAWCSVRDPPGGFG